MIRVLLLLFVAVGIPAAFGQQLSQRATLYELSNSGGEYIFLPQTYSDNLAQQGFDDRTRSVCVTGIWIFYQHTNYNADAAGGAEYVFGRNDYCVNILTVPGAISSVRYAGSPASYGDDSFTLYEYDFFQGEEEFTYTDRPNINLAGNHMSAIITGNSNWTIFDRPDYQGNSLCLGIPLDSEVNTPVLIRNLEDFDPTVPMGSIRSLRKHCPPSPSQRMAVLQRVNAKVGGGVHVTKE